MAPGEEADPVPADEVLVERARGGDRSALEVLLARHHRRLSALCRRICRDPGAAEDATQEALVAIVRGLDRFDGRSAFSTWSHRVTTNACLDELRRGRRRPEPVDPGGREPTLPAAGAASHDDPAEAALGRDERARLAAALDQLPPEFREVVLLRDVADLDYREIGDVLDLAPGTVRSRIARGRARLAALLDHDAGNPARPAGVGTTVSPVRADGTDASPADPTGPSHV